MAEIWMNTGSGWRLGSPDPYDDEAALHKLVQEHPVLLPLSGSPTLMVLGHEVQLGTGYVDILAVELSARPVIIEVKLARNSEARRAIVSQVIAYAAFLKGYYIQEPEQVTLRRQLAQAGYASIWEAVQAQDQSGAVNPDSFIASFQGFLDTGHLSLVIVLDEVSAELERAVAYLDAITVEELTIDLITLSVYNVNGA